MIEDVALHAVADVVTTNANGVLQQLIQPFVMARS